MLTLSINDDKELAPEHVILDALVKLRNETLRIDVALRADDLIWHCFHKRPPYEKI